MCGQKHNAKCSTKKFPEKLERPERMLKRRILFIKYWFRHSAECARGLMICLNQCWFSISTWSGHLLLCRYYLKYEGNGRIDKLLRKAIVIELFFLLLLLLSMIELGIDDVEVVSRMNPWYIHCEYYMYVFSLEFWFWSISKYLLKKQKQSTSFSH